MHRLSQAPCGHGVRAFAVHVQNLCMQTENARECLNSTCVEVFPHKEQELARVDYMGDLCEPEVRRLLKQLEPCMRQALGTWRINSCATRCRGSAAPWTHANEFWARREALATSCRTRSCTSACVSNLLAEQCPNGGPLLADVIMNWQNYRFFHDQLLSFRQDFNFLPYACRLYEEYYGAAPRSAVPHMPIVVTMFACWLARQ